MNAVCYPHTGYEHPQAEAPAKSAGVIARLLASIRAQPPKMPNALHSAYLLCFLRRNQREKIIPLDCAHAYLFVFVVDEQRFEKSSMALSLEPLEKLFVVVVV